MMSKRFNFPLKITEQKRVFLSCLLIGLFGFQSSIAQVVAPTQVVGNYSAVPPVIQENTPPLIMLAMSNDHQLFYKAFTDYEDVDGDGSIDTTYKHNIVYAGYFDANVCYLYDSTDNRFEPRARTDDRYCNTSRNDEWSGSFLNWATMTRIDEIRHVLYGGYRSTDTVRETVLERSYLPNDAHSFAKYYNGTDLGRLTPFGNLTTGVANSDSSGLTICNTTRYAGTALSQNVNEPPLARVVEGNYSLWAANERWQCLFSEEEDRSNDNNPAQTQIYAHSSNPSTSDQAEQQNGSTIGDYVVRVVACTSAALSDPDDCRAYPSGNLKPSGILQKFGEDDSAIWGLMSGSYLKNKSGGVLRKDIGSMIDEINIASDGTFKVPVTGGIIAAINSFRLVNYSVSRGGLYNDTDNCRWGLNSFSNGSCTNWGNPFAEIMLECYRYFSGASANTNFDANDTTLLPNLRTDSTWNNPQTQDTACAELNVIAFNASSVSYDGDEVSTSDLNTSDSAETLTNVVGDGEGITGNSYFVGENGTVSDQLCTAKTVSGLGRVQGTCPDSPRLDGSYLVAGLAHHAYISDLRTDFGGEQTVNTYGVTLAPGIPNVRVTVPGTTNQYISILPACRNVSVGGNCGLVDFKIVSQNSTATTATGRLHVTWEDSEQGGDYDQDLNGIFTYTLTATRLTVVSDVFGQSTGYNMGFGYILGGTTDDGFHAHSGINNYNESHCTSRCNVGDAATSRSYTVGTSSASLLEQPLYYAAKWGGYNDTDGDGTPNNPSNASDVSQWDSDGDGSPDNYVSVVNPIALEQGLESIVLNILQKTASGTAAAVNAQTGRGTGSIYQALYTPKIKEANSELVTWVGQLRSFFIDRAARIREDANGDGILQASDRVIEFRYDDIAGRTLAQRYSVNPDGTTGAASGDPVELSSSDLNPVWDAQDRLSQLTNLTANRTDYSSLGSTGRYIFTAIDRDGDGQVVSPLFASTNGGQSSTRDAAFPFVAGNFNLTTMANDYRYFDIPLSGSETDTQVQTIVDNLINFIRGDESIDGDRNRTLSGSDGSPDEAFLLGDIAHSSPAVVSEPDQEYHLIYRDDSYRNFKRHYENRRVVVYVGANDGMLHAFNGGFYDASTRQYSKSVGGAVAHELGEELWAYVPYNLLPHLKWLQNPNYPHVYYMDGEVKTYDVNIFTPDSTHIDGWGTILVAGMRFGGGDYSFDHDNNASTPDITTRSAYVILDVTDPESPPEVIAEITDEDLGFTLFAPEIVRYRKATDSGSFIGTSENAWYLAFGSGPAGTDAAARQSALDQAVSDKSAKAYVFDLQRKLLIKTELLDSLGVAESSAFAGGFEAQDWDSDFDDDAVYFGVVSGTPGAPAGKLKRGRFTFSGGGTLTVNYGDLYNDSSLPFAAAPTTYRGTEGDYWIFAGTGRFFVPDDNLSSQQQYFFGIKEPEDSSGVRLLSQTVTDSELVDTTHIDLFGQDGSDAEAFQLQDDSDSVITLTVGTSTGVVEQFDDVREFIDQNSLGWKFALEYPVPATLNPRLRSTTKPFISQDVLFFPVYEVTGQQCNVEGFSILYAPHYATGTAAPSDPIGEDDSDVTINREDTSGDSLVRTLKATYLGRGAASEVKGIASPEEIPEGSCLKVFAQTATGEIATQSVRCKSFPSGRQGWREIPVNW